MTTLEPRIESRLSAVRGLAALWVVFTVVFTYLDVPLWNSTLFAVNLVLQASLGGFVITRLLNGLPLTLLLFCGPGLVLGGALWFATFQILGRGAIGYTVSAALGSAALVQVLRRDTYLTTSVSRWWQLCQVTGMAMFVLSTEFSELLPVAAVLFVLGLLGLLDLGASRSRRFWARMASAAGLIIVVSAYLWRRDFWWLVTDDYQFLEVMSRHITDSGPFASWGVNNFARYHWLSYGWAGVLDAMSGSPAPLVTLTRVMPFTYAVSMTSSLVLVATRRHQRSSRLSPYLLAWTVVALGRFDWSGTSTGGAYALVAAAIFLGSVAAELKTPWTKLIVIGVLVVTTVALTKFPSTFALFLVSFSALSVIGSHAVANQKLGRLVRWIGLMFSVPLLFGALWFSSQLLSERFAIASANPGLGQLSTLGLPFAAVTLVVNQLWLWIAVALLVFTFQRSKDSSDVVLHWLAPTFALALLAGLLCDLTISTNADNYTYFSGPLYFTASLSFLFLDIGNHIPPDSRRISFGHIAEFLAFAVAGWLWGLSDVVRSAWDVALRLISVSPEVKVDVLTYFTTDRRIGTAFVAGALFVFDVLRRRDSRWVGICILALITYSFAHLLPQSSADFRRGLPASEVDTYFGSEAERSVGQWLRTHTESAALIATNHGFGADSPSLADFALATWSDREFFVLGPNLDPILTAARIKAVDLSVEFAERPSLEHCEELRKSHIDWFIVDLSQTTARDWSICAHQVFTAGDFSVLKVDSGRS